MHPVRIGTREMALTAKQERFIAEYLIDMNASAAARRAGYSERTAGKIGSENLQKPDIQEEIARRRARVAQQLEITHQTVIAGLHREATLNGEDSSHSARVAAWMGLGKALGMFAERIQGNVTVTLSPEQRRNRIAELEARRKARAAAGGMD